jgi:hypothetical protein
VMVQHISEFQAYVRNNQNLHKATKKLIILLLKTVFLTDKLM